MILLKPIKIFVATHKKFNFPLKECYAPIQCGAEINKNLGYLKDNEGINISSKNPNYCELTVIYYMWKNIKKDNVVGLCHYRRYFYKNIFNNKNNILSDTDIDKITNKYDIILPTPCYFNKSIQKNYCDSHHFEDLLECKNIIKEKYPEFENSFDLVLKRKWAYCFNMIITRKEIFDDYCNWLFDILFDLEKKIDISKYDDYNKRVFGFLSERLLNVYIEKNKHKFKIKELPVYNVDNFNFKQRLSIIKRKTLRFIDFN